MSNLKDVPITSLIAGARVLTGEGGPYALPPQQRDMMCLLDNGIFVVSQSHLTDPYVLGFEERLRRNGKNVRRVRVPLPELRVVYANCAGKTEGQSPVEESTHRQAEVVRIIREAVESGASDVHFVVDKTDCQIRFRIHGQLLTAHNLTAEQGNALCATIYQSMCDVADPIYNPGKSQDARLQRSYLSQCSLYGARVATRPTDAGTLMVLRLLADRRAQTPSLQSLGYLPEQIEIITRMGQRTTGINIFAGPTGSGKSTTLEVTLSQMVSDHAGALHLLTIENPPEYTIAGANQTPLICDMDDDEAISKEWARAISNSMRLDPDVIMVGEVRDYASAAAAFRAAMTGHGVWTTLHANDVVSIMARLQDIGVHISLLSDPSLVTGLINQSLVRTLCPHCSVPFPEGKARLRADIAARVEQTCDVNGVRVAGDGCSHCRGKGISGRSVVAEVIMPTKGFMDTYRDRGKADARQYWVERMGGITKNRHLIRKINQGLVDPSHGELDVCPLDEDNITLG